MCSSPCNITHMSSQPTQPLRSSVCWSCSTAGSLPRRTSGRTRAPRQMNRRTTTSSYCGRQRWARLANRHPACLLPRAFDAVFGLRAVPYAPIRGFFWQIDLRRWHRVALTGKRSASLLYLRADAPSTDRAYRTCDEAAIMWNHTPFPCARQRAALTNQRADFVLKPMSTMTIHQAIPGALDCL
ncbi:hypothetical protein FA95DRAFT_545638 [Auriscalpium vulgare]|uniref:Uncharacterized protein n=1 Tax=Auriscalpium vulgare TaxID=40419 RepID=A0ACB8RFG6_9AGAM|nr:hypothetical protein FA95DRAFT_545638 [Auriscalpium vulgare]